MYCSCPGVLFTNEIFWSFFLFSGFFFLLCFVFEGGDLNNIKDLFFCHRFTEETGIPALSICAGHTPFYEMAIESGNISEYLG